MLIERELKKELIKKAKIKKVKPNLSNKRNKML